MFEVNKCNQLSGRQISSRTIPLPLSPPGYQLATSIKQENKRDTRGGEDTQREGGREGEKEAKPKAARCIWMPTCLLARFVIREEKCVCVCVGGSIGKRKPQPAMEERLPTASMHAEGRRQGVPDRLVAENRKREGTLSRGRAQKDAEPPRDPLRSRSPDRLI